MAGDTGDGMPAHHRAHRHRHAEQFRDVLETILENLDYCMGVFQYQERKVCSCDVAKRGLADLPPKKELGVQ